jgi:MFS family permease
MEDEEYGLYRYRWVVLGAFMVIGALTQLMWLNYASITSTTGTGASQLVGVADIMHVSTFKITQLANIITLLYIPFSIPAGIIIDRKGFRYAVMIGAVFTASFSFLRMFTGNYILVLIGMIGIGIGQPFVLNAITKMVAAWFPTEESALATGIATLSLFLGMIIALAFTPVLLKMFGDNNSGLRWMVLTYSIVATAGAIFFWRFAKAKPAKPPKRTEHELQEEGAAINWASFRKIFKLYDFKLLCTIMFIGNGAIVGIFQLIDQILKPKRISSTTSGLIGAVMVIAGVIGCVVIPSLSDKYRKRKPFIVMSAAVGIPTMFLVAQLSSVAQIYFVSVITGFFLFAAYPLVLTMTEETTGHGLTGTATSILLLLGNLGGVVITLAMEWLKSLFGGANNSFYWSLMFLMMLFVVALVASLLLREQNARFGNAGDGNAGDSSAVPDALGQ